MGNLDELKEFLIKKPDYLEYLRALVRYEEEHKNDTLIKQQVRDITGDYKGDACWTTQQTGVVPARINLLLMHGAIKNIYRSNTCKQYCLVDRPAIMELLKELETAPQAETPIGRQEVTEIMDMDREFDGFLKGLLDDKARFQRVLDFGKTFDIGVLQKIILDMYGPFLSNDIVLAILQQYALSDTRITNLNNTNADRTGFNLAMFGQSGTGKTYAIDTQIRGDEKQGVPAIGLPGRNRFCGVMTPARFLRLGEPYSGRRFNFVVTEFNSWFHYDGMVEPLKLAMEQGMVSHETKNEVIGPYRFDSFFSVNYNTTVNVNGGYSVSVTDPNFTAIEDRTLCRLHRMTLERIQALKLSKRNLRHGKIGFTPVPVIRDHLVLVYAIQTGHALIPPELRVQKNIVLQEDVDDAIDKIDEEFFESMNPDELVMFSTRLAERTIRVAAASALLSFFKQGGQELRVGDAEIRYATDFYREEILIRSGEQMRRR